MQTIWTIRSAFESGHQLEPWCPKCQRHLPPVDLQALVRRGHGEQNIRELGLVHYACGTALLFTLRPPSRHASRAQEGKVHLEQPQRFDP